MLELSHENAWYQKPSASKFSTYEGLGTVEPHCPVLALGTPPVSHWTSKPGTMGCEPYPLILCFTPTSCFLWVVLWLLPPIVPVSRDFSDAEIYLPGMHWIKCQYKVPLVQSNSSMGEAVDVQESWPMFWALPSGRLIFTPVSLSLSSTSTVSMSGTGPSLERVCTAPGTLPSSSQAQLCTSLCFQDHKNSPLYFVGAAEEKAWSFFFFFCLYFILRCNIAARKSASWLIIL